jgi:DNA invertase Pin-like site-specific DNA recombinase
MKIVACYIRVPAGGRNQAGQRREINQWLKSNRIKPKNVRWYTDKTTGKRRQPKLEDLQADILDGKVQAVVVWHLDRLSHRLRDRLSLLIDWCDKPLRVVSVTQRIDVKPGDCELIGPVLRGVKDHDPERWGELTSAGLAKARKRGRVGGRPPVTADDPRVQMVKQLHKDDQLSIDQICRRLKVSRTTYYRFLEL